MSVATTPDSGRPIWKRWTVIGGTILAVVNYLESQNLIPAGTGTELATVVEHLAALLTGLGVYRHIPTT